jgi:tRNA (guanine-N7-)-methyltransferase
MPRGRYPSRRAAPELDPLILDRYRLFWPDRDLYLTPERFPAPTAEALFGRAAPLALDLGCSTGEFLCALAAREPDVCFLGIDLARKPLEHAVANAVARGLDNIRFIQADLRLVVPRIPPESVARIYLHFPVPFQTTGRRKHRTYAPEQLDTLRRPLAPGGRLSLMSDNPEVAAEIAAFVEGGRSFRALPPEQWRLQFDDELKSPYHRRWEARERTIWRWELERASGVRCEELLPA